MPLRLIIKDWIAYQGAYPWGKQSLLSAAIRCLHLEVGPCEISPIHVISVIQVFF